jgi:putative restriction endonuclease
MKIFGSMGLSIGDRFETRAEIKSLGLHSQGQAGISGTKFEGADAIALSGGYPDDKDFGDYIMYTGEGGQVNGKQAFDQDPDSSGNAGLITSYVGGLPIRVFRGSRHRSPLSPTNGYAYAGLYTVTSFWQHLREDGFWVLQFRLDAQSPGAEPATTVAPDVSFATTTISRRVRDSGVAREVKRIYDYSCQLCDTRITGVESRPYAEGAHVRPMGRPHLGADSLENLLCLCANHHVQLDIGGLLIQNDLTLIGSNSGQIVGDLSFRKHHKLNMENVQYHRRLWIRA